MRERWTAVPPPPERASAGTTLVRRLRSTRFLLPLALLVVALTTLMHTGPAHACESAPASASGATVRSPVDHAMAPTGPAASSARHHAEQADAPGPDGGGSVTSASLAPRAAEDGVGAGQHCSSTVPPQAPVLGAGSVVTTVPETAPGTSRSTSTALLPGDRGPPTAERPVLCVWRI